MHIAFFNFKNENNDYIFDFLEQYCLFKDFKFTIDVFNSENQFFKVFEPKKYRIVFFDMSNNGKKCIEASKKIRKVDGNISIIFLASNKFYAYDAYRIYAADYIMKPIKLERLEKTLDKILKNANIAKKFITLNSNKINTKINVNNICYIEVIGNVSCIHMATNEILKVYITLSELEEMLKNNPLFIRTHKSYIVNMDYVANMEGNSFIMKNGDIVAMRKNNCKEIKKVFKKFSVNKVKKG